MAFQPSFDPKTGTIKVLVRLSYFRGFEKTASVTGGKLKYRTNGLMSKKTEEGKANIITVNKAIRAIVEATWPGKDVAKFVAALADRAPLFDGDKYVNEDGDVREHYEDTKFVKLTNDKLPKYKLRNGQDADESERDDLFVSGHWAVAYFHFYAIKDKEKGGNGFFSTLDALQFFKRDEQFSGGGIDDSVIDNLGDDEDDDLNSKDDDDDLGI